jgi:hypothetical protein
VVVVLLLLHGEQTMPTKCLAIMQTENSREQHASGHWEPMWTIDIKAVA